MKTHKPTLEYFQGLNEKLIDFPDKSFYRMDVEEVFGALRSGINFPAMAVESPEGDTEESQISNTVIGRMFAFTILENPQNNNFDDQNEKLDVCERIGLKIIARMRYDNADPSSFLYRRLQVESIKFHKVGPLYTENLYGYRFTGTLKDNESLTVDPDDWSDINSPCP